MTQSVEETIGSADGETGLLGAYSNMADSIFTIMDSAGTSVADFATDVKATLIGIDGKGGVANDSNIARQAIEGLADGVDDLTATQ
jgi:hypothetical protein